MQPRTAALLLLATAIGGQLLLKWRGQGAGAPGEAAYRIGDTTTVQRHRQVGAPRGSELSAGETVDLDVASAGEIARLPGVGPALAKRIVAERRRNGPFGGVACFDARVAGVGEGFLRRVGGNLRFSGPSCASEPGSGAGSDCAGPVDLNRATVAQLDCLPGIGRARAEAIVRFRGVRGGFRGVDDLRGVPGLPAGVVEGLRGRLEVGPMP